VADVLDKKVFSFQDSVAVDVRDIAAAQRWYEQKMRLDYSSTDVEEADLVLGYSAQNAYRYLVKVTGADGPDRTPGRPPIIFAGKLMVAREYLSSRGCGCRVPSRRLRWQSFFRFRDLQGNELEACQEL
jgi:hypothetical protein